jgi:hypothetical protein
MWVLLAVAISVDSALSHLIRLFYQDVAALSEQLQQGVHISLELGEAVRWIPIWRHPTGSASKALAAVTDHADFQGCPLSGAWVLLLRESVEQALGISDDGKIEF